MTGKGYYSGLQMYASHVGAILVIAHSQGFAPTEKRSRTSENRYKTTGEFVETSRGATRLPKRARMLLAVLS